MLDRVPGATVDSPVTRRAPAQRVPPSGTRGPEYFARLRATEYGYLDRLGQVYLDYTGAGLAAGSQVRAHADRLASGVFGNPHSENPTSAASTERVDRARRAILRHLRADPEQYAVIFSANATGANRLVGEAYPFRPGSGLVLTFDNHNSVNGLREFARARGATTTYVPSTSPDLRVSTDTLAEALAGRSAGLLAYPAQSNFSGVQHPLEWVDLAHAHGMDVLLDGAAYLPTNPLDLSAVRPEFVTVSWYKIFGYPTGVGCLVARKDALARLRRPWFAGGTIIAVSVRGDWHWLADDESAFEDGTLNFLNIPDVEVGLDWINTIGVGAIQRRVHSLTEQLLERLAGLRHSGGEPMVVLYGPRDTVARGGTIALNLLDPRGHPVDERLVARESAAAGISLRTGCFCNPGAGEDAFGLTAQVMGGSQAWGRRRLDDYLTSVGMPTGGAVRVSLGLASNLADIERFIEFAEATYRDREVRADDLAPRLRC